jgi:phospholipase C
MVKRLYYVSALFLAVFALAACAATSNAPTLPGGAASRMLPSISGGAAAKVQHVVYVVQENRSFNDVFEGYPGALTVSKGKTSSGGTIALQPISLKTSYDIDHSANGMFDACHGTGKLPGTKCRMDGFDKEQQFGGPPDGMYGYIPHTESKPYFDIAHEFVLADHMFQSQLDESFVAHQYVIAAQAKSSVDVPDSSTWGCAAGKTAIVATITVERQYGKPQRPCFDYETLGDEFDKAGLAWRFYTSQYTEPFSGFWSGYQAVKHIFYGPDWKKDIITPQKRFLKDIKAGKLASFTWITPTCPDSDHLACGGGYGPSWVTAVVNAVGESKFWDSTVVFVQWDDWGGMYDPVAPKFKDYDGVGFRVPLIVISAYARKNVVTHGHYETASVLRFAEDLFGLGQLSAADARANDPMNDPNVFDFKQKPRKYVPIKAPEDENFFLNQPVDPRIPDTQ